MEDIVYQPIEPLDDTAYEHHQCETDGCTKEGIPCRLWDDEEKDYHIFYYCGDHIHDEGFCWGCGEFWAGCENFDFSPNGLCSECRSNPDIVGYDEGEEDEAMYYYPGPWDN